MKKILKGFVERSQPFWKIEGVNVEHYVPLLAKMMLDQAGEEVDLAFLETSSGHSTYFVYDRLKPWVYDLKLRKMLLRAIESAGWELQIYSPRDFEDAYDFIRKNIEKGKPVFCEFAEPLVFYGIDDKEDGPVIHWFNAPFAAEGDILTKEELRRRLSRARKRNNRNNDLIVLDKPMEPRPDHRDVAISTFKTMVGNVKREEFMGFSSGFNAYASFAKDLRDEIIDWLRELTEFPGHYSAIWGCWASYHQWTPRVFSAQYMEQAAILFTGEAREHIRKAATHFRRCVKAWLNWESLIGRDWELLEDNSLDEETRHRINNERSDIKWSDIKNRRRAADTVEEAGKWERNAIEELEKALKLITA